MGIDFLFTATANIDRHNLQQGDLLVATPALKEVIGQAHTYYATSYRYFMVLTQSCDLVIRGKKPKASYITLAAVRPLSDVVERKIKQRSFENSSYPIPVFPSDQENWVKEFLERLLHNTEDGFFCIPANSTPNVGEDLCAFLQLSVALRSEHYNVCLEAKIAQLDDVFQAKLGWLTGNLYSRVGTPDIEERMTDPEGFKQDFFEKAVFGSSAWLSPEQHKTLKNLLKVWKSENKGKSISAGEFQAIVNKVPSDQELFATRAAKVLADGGVISSDQATLERARNLLVNDAALLKLAKYLA